MEITTNAIICWYYISNRWYKLVLFHMYPIISWFIVLLYFDRLIQLLITNWVIVELKSLKISSYLGINLRSLTYSTKARHAILKKSSRRVQLL